MGLHKHGCPVSSSGKKDEDKYVERAQLTSDNISTIAKRTGRSELDLWKAYNEAKARGGTASVMLTSLQEIWEGRK